MGGALRSAGRAVDPTTTRGLANLGTGGLYEMNSRLVGGNSGAPQPAQSAPGYDPRTDPAAQMPRYSMAPRPQDPRYVYRGNQGAPPPPGPFANQRPAPGGASGQAVDGVPGGILGAGVRRLLPQILPPAASSVAPGGTQGGARQGGIGAMTSLSAALRRR